MNRSTNSDKEKDNRLAATHRTKQLHHRFTKEVVALKVSLYLVTYEEKKRTEILFKELPEEEKKKLSSQITDKFMQRAGFSPAPG